MSMTATSPSLAMMSERELRRQIDRSLSRALTDYDFARHLLADPTVVLDARGCTPQQYLDLRSINAHTISEFAGQAMALFWAQPYPAVRAPEEALQAAAAI